LCSFPPSHNSLSWQDPEEGFQKYANHCFSVTVAEKTFIEARRLSNKFPRLSFILISHASKAATDKWVTQVGGAWSMSVVVDPEREVYAAWGLGVSTTYHLLNPWTQMAMRKLGTEEGIWAREVDASANRWLVGGAWGVDEGELCFSIFVWESEESSEVSCGCFNWHFAAVRQPIEWHASKRFSESRLPFPIGTEAYDALCTILLRTFETDIFPVGTIRYGGASKTADDIPDLVEACKALGAY